MNDETSVSPSPVLSWRRVATWPGRFSRRVVDGFGLRRSHRRLLGSGAALALVAALTATGVGFYALRAHAEAVEGQRLDEEAQLGVAAFNSFAQDVESIVSGGLAIAVATDGDGAAFETALAPRVRTTAVSSLALLHVGDDAYRPASEVGRREALLPRQLPEQFARRIDEIAEGGGLDLVEVAELEEGRAIGLAARASDDSPYLVYAELLLPEVLSLTAGADNGDARYALYFGDEVEESLVLTNATKLPIEGRRVTRMLRLGNQRPLLVFSTGESLAGGFTTNLPWGVLGVGILLSLFVTSLLEATRRRHVQAAALVADLEYASAELDRSEERYGSLFQNANDLVFMTDTSGTFEAINDAAEQLLGYSSEELIGRHFEELVAPELVERSRDARERKLRGEIDVTTYDTILLSKDGEAVELEVTSQTMRERGEPVGVQGIGRDTRERNRLEVRFRSLVQNSSDVIAVVSADLVIDYASPSAANVLGYAPEALIERDLQSLFDDDDWENVSSFLAGVAPDEPARSTEACLQAGDGGRRDVEIVASNLLDDSAVGGIVLTVRDVTERMALERELRFQAFHDSLTRLANRALFADRVGHALSRAGRRDGSIAVLFIDLDDFKTINDSLGHEAGDRLLVAIADRLSASVRPSDTCARLGGDEFAVLLDPVMTREDAGAAARRVREALRAPVSVSDRDVRVHVSIGLAVADRPMLTADDLLRRADAAMYAAKRERVQSVREYEPAMHEAALARLELKGELELALARNEFSLRFQPIFGLADARLVAIEALVRWEHPRRGLLTPEAFIDLAEETGLIVSLGRWVITRAAQFYVELREEGLIADSVAITINTSTRELDEPMFATELVELITGMRLDPADLVLEITERSLVGDHEGAVRKLHELRKLGIRVAVDDFGTGYSSLSTLQRFPVDMLKIAKPFIDDVVTRTDSLADAIVRLGSTLGLETVAEGIENEDQLRRLRHLGCAYGQGFHLCGPLSADGLAQLLREGRLPSQIDGSESRPAA